MASKLFDKRSEFFREFFETGLPYEGFLGQARENHISRWRQFESKIGLSKEQEKTILEFKRKMYVICLAGTWCGDCARQCPILQKIADLNKCIELRFLDNQANPAIADELRIHGASRVPVVVVLSEDFFEIARFGDRTLSSYRRKANQELGPSCDSGLIAPSAGELQIEISEWVEFFERLQLMLRMSGLLRERHSD